MKKVLVISLVMIIVTLGLFPGTTCAASYETYNEYAMDLYSIGLFNGTEIGFELDRVPTRLEGAVMFVRLLGGEQEAMIENYSHPFKDVPDWGNPYVGYLYHYQLTNGISNNDFGSYQELRAMEYVTFGLRALGFSDKGPGAEFSWDTSVNFAKDNEILTDELNSELVTMGFTRGHVAWVSFELLGATFNGENIQLIDVLVSEGSINENSAGSIFTKFNKGTREVPSIGDLWITVLSQNGSPTDGFLSRYGFEWNIFGMDYNNYIQIGEQSGEVKAVLSASNGYGYEKDISIGMTKSEVTAAYGNTGLTEIRKLLPDGNSAIIYQLNNSDKATYVTEAGDYITYYYDMEEGIVAAFMVIEKETEEAAHDNYCSTGYDMEEALESQIYHITNAFRVQKGKDILAKSIAAFEIAENHSNNMVEYNFFSHTDLQGNGPGERATQRGIPYRFLGENLAMGYKNSVDMVNGWLNSQTGHRETLLGDYEYIGIGVSIKDSRTMYCTQEYWR